MLTVICLVENQWNQKTLDLEETDVYHDFLILSTSEALFITRPSDTLRASDPEGGDRWSITSVC